MSTMKIDGDWITLDDHRVARLVDDLPHWLMVELRDHEGSPDEWVEKGYKEGCEVANKAAYKEGYSEGYDIGADVAYEEGFAAGRADALRDEIGA